MLALALALALAPPAPPAGEARLVTGTGLRLRAAPDANAAVVERVPLGTTLSCLETSAPVRIGEATAPFCKTEKGWYFTALTEPLAADPARRAAQIDALIAARIDAIAQVRVLEESKWPDLYELHNLMRTRIEARTNADDKMRARIAELSFVAAHPNVFEKDPRVVGDDSQGPRVKNEAFEELVAASKGTGAHEDAAWALAQHGLGGECEGDVVCELIRIDRTTCRFIAQFPSGARAAKAVEEIANDLEAQDPTRGMDDAMKKDARDFLARVKACVTKTSDSAAKKRALAAIADAEKRWK